MTLDPEYGRDQKQSPDAPNKAKDETAKSDQKIAPLVAEPQMPPPNGKSHDGDGQKKHWTDYASFGLEFIGLVVLCIYAVYTIKIYCANRKAAVAATTAANAAKSAADTAASQLELSERPWITTIPQIIGPLTFDQSGGRIEFLFQTKNVGNSPAIDVWVRSEIYLASIKRADPIKERDRFCLEVASESGSLGQTIFPNTKNDLRVSQPIDRKDIVAVTNDMNQTYKIKDWRFLNSSLITCAAYSSSFNPSKRYYTGVLYSLQKRSPLPVGAVSINVDENVPAANLVLLPSTLAGTLAR